MELSGQVFAQIISLKSADFKYLTVKGLICNAVKYKNSLFEEF